jgi:hypothetical protein
VLALIIATVWWTGNRRPPRTIGDRQFAAQANAVCARELPSLRPAEKGRQQNSKVDRPAPKEAIKVERAAIGLEVVAQHLGAIPVREADAAKVRAWIADWVRYAKVGHTYAGVLRKGDDPARFTKAASEGNAVVHRIARFARGNHIDDCVV